VQFALDTLAGIFGTSIRRAVRAGVCTGWNQDDLTYGTYSAPLPGQADARGVPGRPINDRLFFAGEAIPVAWAGDVHGAYQSGLDAAEAMLGRSPRGAV